MFNSNNKIEQSQWYYYFLVAIAISTNLMALLALIIPDVANRSIANFQFPQQIKLSSGQAISISKSNDLTPSARQQQVRQRTIEVPLEIMAENQKYQYEQKGSPVNLEISYLTNTRGDVGTYLSKYTDIAPEAIHNRTIAQLKNIGHHTLLKDDARAYLSSCISPRSPSNVSQKQFSEYRYQNDLTFKVAWEWLQGKSSIRDRRCLWVHLSVPLTPDVPTAYQVLESTWQEVYQWWLPNFPPL